MPAIRSLTDEPLQTMQQWTLDSKCCSQWLLRGNDTARKHNILCTCCLAWLISGLHVLQHRPTMRV